MAKVSLNKLNLKMEKEVKTIDLESAQVNVLQYLPQQEKASFIEFVLNYCIDDSTGCSSPIREETYFMLAIIKYYTDINLTDKQIQDAPKTYDLLETNGIFDMVIAHIPEEEFQFIRSMTTESIVEIVQYNTSFMGIAMNFSKQSSMLDSQVTDILEKIKNKEGLELLDGIKQIVG